MIGLVEILYGFKVEDDTEWDRTVIYAEYNEKYFSYLFHANALDAID